MTDYDIYPVHLMDAAKVNHKVMGWTMRFNDVLDAEMLRSAMKTLVEVGNWRKLGGRLRRNVSDICRHSGLTCPATIMKNISNSEEQSKGQLEIHVPKQFTEEFPAFEYKHDTEFQDKTLNSHPVGRAFLGPTDQPSIQQLPETLRQFMAPEDFPDTVDGLVESDKPQVAITIVSFKDATLVSLAIPHTLGDIVTLVQMIHNWSLVVAGRVKEVPPCLDAHTDALEEVANDPAIPADVSCLMEKKRLGRLGVAKFIVRQLWERSQRNRQLRAVYIPKDAYQRLISKVRADAQQQSSSESDEDKKKLKREVKLGEADIVTAWLTRIIASQEVGPRPVTILSLYNIRYQLKSLLQAKGMFAQIMVSITCATFPGDTAAKNTLAQNAQSYRQQVAEQSTPEQVVAYLRLVRRELKGGSPSLAIYGEADALLIFCNPLAKLNLMRMANFAPAVLPSGEETGEVKKRMNPPGTIVCNVFNPLNWKDAGLDALFPLGADHSGGNWIMAKMSPESWDTLEKELKNL